MDPEKRRKARRAVKEALREHGRQLSWRALKKLLPDFTIALLRTLLRRFKRCLTTWAAQRAKEIRAATRVSTHVEMRGVLSSLDSTHLGEDEHGNACWAMNLREVANSETTALALSGPATGEGYVQLLERARSEHGSLPLVLSLDNGGPERGELLEGYCRTHQVLLLHSEPYTPQHNTWVERGHLEVKRYLDIVGEQGTLAWMLRLAWERLLARARHFLNAVLPRPRLGGKTSLEARQRHVAEYDPALRARFYAAACAAKDRALQELPDGTVALRARRKAERRAIWKVLEDFNLVRRTRDGADASGA
jgi:hypothetical protein